MAPVFSSKIFVQVYLSLHGTVSMFRAVDNNNNVCIKIVKFNFSCYLHFQCCLLLIITKHIL